MYLKCAFANFATEHAEQNAAEGSMGATSGLRCWN